MFQSRNRESSNFNFIKGFLDKFAAETFQSRNRESSNFNADIEEDLATAKICFNLVIENLLISTGQKWHTTRGGLWFQSRNRESSNFNILETRRNDIRVHVSIS